LRADIIAATRRASAACSLVRRDRGRPPMPPNAVAMRPSRSCRPAACALSARSTSPAAGHTQRQPRAGVMACVRRAGQTPIPTRRAQHP
jgi:hypothetical protein